jgi:hypothetical protein
MLGNGDLIGFLASALVLATFAMKDMRRLRVIAILSNLAFIAYGALCGLLPVLALHLLLLPLNVLRLRDERGTASSPNATRGRLAPAWGMAAAAIIIVAVAFAMSWYLPDEPRDMAIAEPAADLAVSDTPFEDEPSPKATAAYVRPGR